MNVCIVNCFDTYEHRVDLLLNVFKSQGHRVCVLSSDFRHIEKTKRKEKKNGYKFFPTEPYSKNLSAQRMRSHMHISSDIARYIEKNIEKIDLIWVLIPPNSLVREISEIKAKHPRVKLIFDLIDLWPETMPAGKIKNLFPFTYWKNLRDNYLCMADCIVTECDLYRKKLKNVLKDLTAETLYLAKPYMEYIPSLHLPADKLSLCYLGSINNIIDIDTIVMIVKQCLKKHPVELHIIGDGENRNSLISRIQATGADVIYHGKIYDRKEKQNIFDGCHFGLNIMKPSVCVGLTMKSMDYFEFGLPVINNIQGDTWELVRKYDIGVNFPFYEEGLIEKSSVQRRNARNYFDCFLTERIFSENVMNIVNLL